MDASESATSKQKGQAVLYDNAALKAFIRTLPFRLTDGQKSREWDLFDLRAESSCKWGRKTIVATIAMVAAAPQPASKPRSWFPTEILAEQHMLTIEKLIQDTVGTVLLTGSIICVRRRNEKKLLAQIEVARDRPYSIGTCLVPTRREL